MIVQENREGSTRRPLPFVLIFLMGFMAATVCSLMLCAGVCGLGALASRTANTPGDMRREFADSLPQLTPEELDDLLAAGDPDGDVAAEIARRQGDPQWWAKRKPGIRAAP